MTSTATAMPQPGCLTTLVIHSSTPSSPLPALGSKSKSGRSSPALDLSLILAMAAERPTLRV